MRICLLLAIATAAVLELVASQSHAAEPGIAKRSRPNIVLILTDDHGWSQLSESMDPAVAGARSDYLETPNMTRLAKQGMRFTAGYSPAPLCTPTRRSILCGTSAARSGPEFKSAWVPADHTTIPTSLKSVDASYRCAHYGKWGEQMLSTPQACGYDESDGVTGNVTGGMPSSLGVKGSHGAGPPHFIDNKDPKRTSSVTSKAIEFMRKQSSSGNPFYVQVSYYAQHLSVVTSDAMLAKYQAKGTPDRGYTEAWAAMMEELDHGVGRILDAVTDLEIEGQTYVFFTSDNGARGTIPGGDADRKRTNFPLTGEKHNLYEGGIRVPFMVLGPGVEAGSICRTPVVGYDFLPTFYDLAGGDVSQLASDVDGVSIKALLSSPQAGAVKREIGGIVFHRPNRLFSVIRGDEYKLMLYWKPDGEVDRHELYDLATNPEEEGNDLAGEQRQQAEAMKSKLMQYLQSVAAEKPQPMSKKQLQD